MSNVLPIDISNARWFRRQIFRLIPMMGWVTRAIWQSSQESRSSWHEHTQLRRFIWRVHRSLSCLPRLRKFILLVSLNLDLKMNLDLSRLNDVFVFCYGAGESDVLYVSKMFLRQNSIVFDVGANIGSTTLVFAKQTPQGKVYAFEPSREMCQVLAENIGLSKLHNVSIEPYGLSDTLVQGGLHLDMVGNPGSAYFIPDPMADITLNVLDNKFGNDFHVDFIKIDVEGYECHVLSGAIQIINRCKPILVIEVNQMALNRSGSSSTELLGLVCKLGYRLFYLDRSCLRDYISFQQYSGPHNIIAVHPDAVNDWQVVERFR